MADVIEQTLYICREANVFKIPPRMGAGGYRSGDWKLSDKIFTGRVKAVAKGDDCEVRLEDPSNGTLFACCPVPKGQRDIAVEQASDSSRNFVLRLVDPTNGRHAFVGLSFAERGEAFDFNVALSDHEKHSERAVAFEQVAGGTSKAPAQQETVAEAELLYKKQDLSLKQGQTIKINMKGNHSAGASAGSGGSGGLVSRSVNSGSGLMPLPPPPSASARSTVALAPPPAAASASSAAAAAAANPWGAPVQPPPAAGGGFDDLFGGFGTSAAPVQQQQQAPPPARDGWATFD